jgi:ubiquinone/menaquinone biosynthesis C-methylase UbiE
MAFSVAQWHQRYTQQAQWSASLRAYLMAQIGIQPSTIMLDVGCGTGVLEKDLMSQYQTRVFGLDLDAQALQFARTYAPSSIFISGDAIALPFASGNFDITFCHFVLLWIQDVHQALAEMVRVTRPNGYVIALAEPDYGGRIDYPDELSQLGRWQQESLLQQGANPCMGRELRALFHQSGLKNVEAGVMGGQWADVNPGIENQLEWDVIAADLSGNPDFLEKASLLNKIDQLSREAGQRILFVPTFYAIGVVRE